MTSPVEQKATGVGKKRKARTWKRDLCNARASISRNPTRRGEKTSRYIGVKVRGKRSISIEFRPGTGLKRITAAYFMSQEQAAMAYDLARRIFIDEASYLQLGEGKLNFWKDSAFINQFFKDNGLEEFVGKDEWDKNMATNVRAMATKAFTDMDIDRGVRTGLPSHYENSRESLAAISPSLAELEVEEDAFPAMPNDNHSCTEHVKDASTVHLEVHEAEVELSKDTQQNSLLEMVSEDKAGSKAGNETNTSNLIGIYSVPENQGPATSDMGGNGNPSDMIIFNALGDETLDMGFIHATDAPFLDAYFWEMASPWYEFFAEIDEVPHTSIE